uniref:Uncharacterized protein n=1 Tax=Caenorhabditis tropicalis TaxID=1561998 RepID=A0A1I7UXX4_9PELO
MHFLLILLVALPHANTFLFGGGCCGAPVVQSPCCGGATSWAYAPPQVIGYERIPLYAKVPMPAPPSYVQPPPSGYVSQPVAPQGYQQQPPQQQFPGQIEQGIEVTPEQISSGYQPQQQFGGDSSNYGPQSGNQFGSQGSQFGSQSGSQSSGLVDSVASSAAYEATGIAPNARRLRKFKN